MSPIEPNPSQGPAAPHFEANAIFLCKNCGGFQADHKPNEAGEPHYCRLKGDSPLTGEWRYNMGYLCCGTLRIFRADFDTPPSEEFKATLTGWMVKTLNAAQAGAHPIPPAPVAAVLAAFAEWKNTYAQTGQQKVMDALWALEAAYAPVPAAPAAPVGVPTMCPRCNGQGRTHRPPWVPGDQATWPSTTAATHPCPPCNGTGILWSAHPGSASTGEASHG